MNVNINEIKIDPRLGWSESCKEMAKAGDDRLLDPEILDHEFDQDEWCW